MNACQRPDFDYQFREFFSQLFGWHRYIHHFLAISVEPYLVEDLLV